MPSWFQIGESPEPVERRVDLVIARRSGLSQQHDVQSTRPVEMLHLSDFHFRPGWFPAYDRQLARFAGCRPSLILVTGDFIDDKFDPRPALPVMRRYLEKLQSIAPVVGCLGNHDGDLLAPHLIDAGVRVLLNEIHCVTCSGIPIEIIGAAGVARVDLDVPRLEAQLATRSSPDPINAAAGQGVRIILSHYPDAIHALAKLKPDIVLAGHTHGGQVCLPGGRPIITHDSLPLEHTTGLTTPEGVMLSISRGLGMSTYRIRLFCPSEFTRLSIRIQAGESF